MDNLAYFKNKKKVIYNNYGYEALRDFLVQQLQKLAEFLGNNTVGK